MNFPEGEMGTLISQKDWASTPIGAPETWSLALRTTVRILLTNRFPMLLWWGPQYIQLYNDPYSPIPGDKHPQSLGQSGNECWKEIWHILGPLIDTPFKGGPATWIEDLELEFHRTGFSEETHFTVAYSPVPDETAPGGIGGVLATVHEITDKVIGERRILILRDLGARAAEAKTAEEACITVAEILGAHIKDIPFALLYLTEPDCRRARLAASSGIEKGTDLSSVVLELNKSEGSRAAWPLDAAQSTEQMQVVESLSSVFDNIPPGYWSDPPHTAVVLPIRSNIERQLSGFLVAGLSPRLKLDDAYRSFLELTTSLIATAITNARAYEEERKRAEALAEIDRAKTAFFSNVSHEFRTPLTLMLGPLEEMLAMRGALNPNVAELAVVTHRNALRLQKLVNTLLDFSRIEAGRVQAMYEPTGLAAFTAELAGTFRSAMEKAGLQFVVECQELPESVYVDREMWEKVVLNLLSNAFKYTLAGRVTVRVSAVGEGAMLSIEDTGIGIAPHELPHLFERFRRVEGARGRTQEGTGIGLALVQELVRQHGGSIEVRSVQDEGSTFTVILPFGTAHLPRQRLGSARSRPSTALRAESYVEEAALWLAGEESIGTGAADLPTRQASPVAAQAPLGRVLLADDNADMRSYVRRLLESHYEVEAVGNGREALARALRHPPDLVLSDVMMPELDGFALLKALREDPRTRTVPVILLSARAGEESRSEGMDRGADDYLIKPFSARELLARVRAHITLARARREAEEQLRRQWHSFDTVLSNMPDALYIFDLEGRFTYANHALLSRLQIPLEQALGKNGLEVGYPPEIVEHVQEQIRQVVKTGQPIRDSLPFNLQAGDSRYYEYILFPVFAADGSVEAIAGSSRDITERKHAEDQDRERQERLLESARLESLGVMAGGIAHDFNNLLVGILGNGSLLAETAQESDREIAEDIVHAAERAADLTKQLLAYSGKGRFIIEVLDLNSLIQENLTLLRASLSRNVSIGLELGAEACFVEGDRTQIHQIIMNLLINASEAVGDRPGRVTIRTKVVERHNSRFSAYLHTIAPAGGYALLEVEDDGTGMTSETLKKIFDPFFTTKFTGRGLGLAAVLGIVKGHHGDIEVETQPGSGATFRIFLPVSERAGSPKRKPGAEIPVTVPDQTVLVVDDEAIVRKMATLALERGGFRVLSAPNGEEALDLLRANAGIALVILGLTMPVMTGEEALPLMRAMRPEIPILLSSGFNEAEISRRFASTGIAGVLQKPYSVSTITFKVAQALQVVASMTPRTSTA